MIVLTISALIGAIIFNNKNGNVSDFGGFICIWSIIIMIILAIL